jgi:signal transduction histidine kinase
VKEVFAAFDRPDQLDGRELALAEECADVMFETDIALLKQVLGCMTKNGIEAAVPGERVTIGCRPSVDGACFWVDNPTYMPENVRRQVFNRSFSTKGTGRGLGTYSMKILTDHYLGGRIDFTSSEETGTRFTAIYPRAFQLQHTDSGHVSDGRQGIGGAPCG